MPDDYWLPETQRFSIAKTRKINNQKEKHCEAIGFVFSICWVVTPVQSRWARGPKLVMGTAVKILSNAKSIGNSGGLVYIFIHSCLNFELGSKPLWQQRMIATLACQLLLTVLLSPLTWTVASKQVAGAGGRQYAYTPNGTGGYIYITMNPPCYI